MLFNVVTAVIIPFLVQLLKMIKLPTKFAPIAAVVLAVVIVAGAKWLGVELDFNTMTGLIANALGVAGVSVLGYDLFRQVTK